MRTSMDEGTGRFWTVIFGGITSVGLIVGGLYSLVQYQHNKAAEQQIRENETRNFALQLTIAQLEAKKPFFSKQLDFCNDLSESVAKASVYSRRQPETKDPNWLNFWVLFWGRLRTFAGPKVFETTLRFGDCLNDAGECHGKAPFELAMDVANACRSELSENWQIDLPKLEEHTGSTSQQK